MSKHHFKKVKRSALLFLFLSLITLGIYSAVVLSKVKKEYDLLSEDSPSHKSFAPYVVIFLLGFITLGIVPLIYLGYLSDAYGELLREEGIKKPKISYGTFVLWCVFGSLIIVGPFIAFHKLFKVAAILKTKSNERAEAYRILEEKKEKGEADVALAEDSPAVMPSEVPANVVPTSIKGEEGPAALSAMRSIPGPQTMVLPPLDPAAPVDPMSMLLAKYATCPPGTFAVRVKPSSPVLRTFAKKEDAIAFAKELAALRKVSVQYRKKQ